MHFKVASVDSFVIEFSSVISIETSHKIKYYFDLLNSCEEVVDVVPSYTTLLVTFNIFKTSYQDLQEKILAITYESSRCFKGKGITIPVYYGKEVGLDLERIATFHKITIDEIITKHTSKPYTVFTIGFAPGFAYLGEVEEKIAMARLESPRKIIPKGSVAIADRQTAIYPQNSPGGWNIIGRTPFKMFDKSLESLCPVSMGDEIVFESICKEKYLELGGEL